ncbi:integrase [Polynucleobacter sphagniphilus]|uniref:tyrosine-type recombinase/integrase n=1 Tax=Polynucleobacter sphagniphilus TaxID=1743169 RepID=UPI002475C811|nr:tyrosine-type recombinase/integrase [Polynucleobacter sphagniphilus]MDH6302639.1 integrase [Polynucleobacter sphagniphilus]
MTKTSKPSHLVKRYNTYFAVLYVPKEIQYIIGKAKFSKSTGTDNKKLAETIAQVYVMGWKAEIESARSKSDDPLIQSAKDIRKLLKSSPAHLVQDAIDEEIAKLNLAKKEIHAEVFEQIATGKNQYLEDVLKNWKKHEEDRGLSQKNIDQMFSDIEIMTTQFPTAPLITAKSVDLWIRHIAKKGKLSASSVTRIIGSSKNFFKYLQFIKEIPQTEPNPFIVPVEFKISNKPNSKSVNKTQSWLPFSPKEIVSLYKIALDENQKLADLILIAMYTGARIEEICSLLCKDVDLKEESITIVDAKTEAGERTIPIHPYIKDRIEKLIEDSTDDYLLSGLTKNKYGDRANSLGQRFGRLKTRQKFSSRYVFHSIRKTFTTMLENAGVGENLAADIVGHEKPRITYGLYSGGASLEVMREAIMKIAYDI